MEAQSTNFYENLDKIIEAEQREFEQAKFQKYIPQVKTNSPVQEIEEVSDFAPYCSSKSIYQKKLSKNKVIREFFTYTMDLKILGTKCIELSHKDKINIAKQYNGISMIEMLDILSEGDNRGKEEYLENLKFDKEYKGKVFVERHGLIMEYMSDKDGKVFLREITDIYAYKYTGEEFDGFDNLNCTELSIKVANAFSKAYPYYPKGDVIVIDLERVANKGDNLTIGEVAYTFMGYSKTGYMELVNTNLNTKHKHYLQAVRLLDKSALPILDRTGSFEIDNVPVRMGMFNNVKSEKEIKYNINMIRNPETTKNLLVFAEGETGFVSNGEIACVERSEMYSDIYPAFNIYLSVNTKKSKRFKENARLHKALGEDFVSSVGSKTIIETELIAENVVINTESDFVLKLIGYLSDRQPILNLDGGAFDLEYNRDEVREKVYREDTVWTEINTSTRLKGESDKEYKSRISTLKNMGRRFASSTDIKGLYTTKSGKKYSNSAVNRIGASISAECKTMTRDGLNTMKVQQVVNFDMLTSMVKSKCVYENNIIDEKNKEVRKVMDLYFKGDNGKLIKFEKVQDKDKYIKKSINTMIEQHMKQNPCNDVDLETLKKAHRVKDIGEKKALLNGILEIDLMHVEQDYYMMKEQAETTVNFLSNYQYADTLNSRDREKLSRIADDYRKATGKVLEIQGLKAKVVNLSKEIIADNKEAIKQLGKEDKEIKSMLREENKHLSRINRALKKNIFTETTYNDYKTSKFDIILKEECEKLIELSNKIIESDIQNKIEYDMSKQINLQVHLNSILNRDFEIQAGCGYSLDWLNLENVHLKLNIEDYTPRYRRYKCA